MASDYLRSGEQTGGIRNLMLFYNGHYENGAGVWKKGKFLPYVAYLNPEGEPLEWLFDGGLFLAKWSFARHGFEESHDPTDMRDWLWYLDKTFAPGGDLAELNAAVAEAGEKLGDAGYRMKVVLMIPYPAPNQALFGELDGRMLCFDHAAAGPEEAQRNKRHALDWYVAELANRWRMAGFNRLRLSGLYWMNEAVRRDVPGEEELVRYAGELVHNLQLRYFWIPYFRAEAFESWAGYGFDAAVLQPNHFFSETTDEGRIAESAQLAKQAGMGVEVEVDFRIWEAGGKFRRKYLDYLNGGLKHGFDGDVFRGYYQDVDLMAASAYSKDPARREAYDWTYRFVKGKFERQDG
ncbi:DUF4855 domain-containing protein [Paenibacillus sp. MBLB4367]|uniref:DUF4855 domain-containing protein n=1 Tax=Paenibacillus sp. MBLB4367 TaxID=3384767 RepID=UPI0039082D43